MVPIQLGTLHINKALDLVSETEMINLSNKWNIGRLSTLLASKSMKTGMENSKTFTLDQVKGGIELTKIVKIPAFETIQLQELPKVRGHQQCINMVTELPIEKYSNSITTVTSYTCLKPGSGHVTIALCNLMGKNIVLKPNTVVAKISAANVVPHMLASKSPESMINKQATAHPSRHHNMNEPNTCSSDFKWDFSSSDAHIYDKIASRPEKLVELFNKLDLSGIQDWEEEDQQEVRSLITEYGFLFALDNLDLEKHQWFSTISN